MFNLYLFIPSTDSIKKKRFIRRNPRKNSTKERWFHVSFSLCRNKILLNSYNRNHISTITHHDDRHNTSEWAKSCVIFSAAEGYSKLTVHPSRSFRFFLHMPCSSIGLHSFILVLFPCQVYGILSKNILNFPLILITTICSKLYFWQIRNLYKTSVVILA